VYFGNLRKNQTGGADLLQLSMLHTCSLLHHLAAALLHACHGCCPPAPVPHDLKASHPRTPPPWSYPPGLPISFPSHSELLLAVLHACCLLCCLPWLLLPLLLAATAPVTRRSTASSVETHSAATAGPLLRRLLRVEVAAYTNARALPHHRCLPEPEPPLRRATASAPS
jgi:hypothetical protein